MLGGSQASAQTAPPSQDQAARDAKADNPGLISEIGRVFGQPIDLFSSLKLLPETAPSPPSSQPGDTVGMTPPPATALPAPAVNPAAPNSATLPAATPAKPAAGLVPQMIRGRASCPVAANGSPDCKAGADKLCQDKGFSGGSSLDMDSARTCSTKALLAGARHIKDICKTENFVTRAMCL